MTGGTRRGAKVDMILADCILAARGVVDGRPADNQTAPSVLTPARSR
jgi:hypothetical protein